MIYRCQIDTPLGSITAAAEQDTLTGLWFEGQKYYPSQSDQWTDYSEHEVFKALRLWLTDYFEGKDEKIMLKLCPKGTPFQRAVWDMLLEIPFGQMTTYGEIAKKIAQQKGVATMSAQAIGGAVGHNPISILIPCHRVVGAKKNLTGYAGGLDKKEALLKIEQGQWM